MWGKKKNSKTLLVVGVTLIKLLLRNAALTVGEILVRAGRLNSGMSLSRSDNRDLYASASIIKSSAGRRVSQFGIKSDSRHILQEQNKKIKR